MGVMVVRAKHVRGSANLGTIRIFVMNGITYQGSSGSTPFSGSPSVANSAMINSTAGGYPSGLEYATTLLAGHDSGTVLTMTDEKLYHNDIRQDDFIAGDRLVFENGSYVYIQNSSFTDNPSREGGACYLDLQYFTVDNEQVYNGSYRIKCEYGKKAFGESNRPYYTADAFPWKTIQINGGYRLYRCAIDQSTEYHQGTQRYLPVYRTTWNSSAEPNTVGLSLKFFDGIPEDDPDDPYPDDDSDDDFPDGPDGVPDPDPVPIPDPPVIDVTDTGFITLFTPTLTQLKALSSYMWSNLFDVASFKKLFADPMDCILGLNILPITVPYGSVADVMVGNISTGVGMRKVSNQWVTVECGSVNIGKIYDTYLDFAPYTKWSIYLPFIGLQQLSADDVAHKELTLTYRIDVLSCACVAYLKAGDSVLYQYSGTCGYSIPLSSNNFASTVSNMVSIATTAGSLLASGGVTAPMAVGAGASLANNVMGLKPDIKRSGSIGASTGIMGIQKPYLIVESPNICKPTMQHKYLGYPSFITKTVRDVEGYSEWEAIILDGIPCTDEERSEILDIMKGGIYV